MLLAMVGLSLFARYNAHAIQLKTVQIPIHNLKSPSKILYLSDVHIARKSDLPFLQKIIKLINEVDADFVVIN